MKIVHSIVAASLLVTGLNAADAAPKDGVSYVIDDRLRYESVSQDNATDDATALTNRFMLGVKYKTGALTADIELANVSALMSDYDDGTGSAAFSVVKDPAHSRLTQAKLTYSMDKTAVIAGRQMINLDNQRFVGAVDWRQMRQTFDAVVVANSSVKDLTLVGAYVIGVNPIVDVTARKTSSVILHADYKVSDTMNVTGYGYLLASLHDTYGVALTGKAMDKKLSYRAEYAMQSDASFEVDASETNAVATGAGVADASYMNFDAAYALDKTMTAGFNYEVLSGTDGTGTATAFGTPLATGHKFNGWADIFLTTPTDGLVDMNARFVYKAKGLGKFMAVYHMFSADVGGADHGSEIDFLHTNAVASVKGMSYLVKYASYTAGDTQTDTTKLWAGVAYKFASK